MVESNDLKFNKKGPKPQGNSLLIPLEYDPAAFINANTIGYRDSAPISDVWPSWPEIDGQTAARYEISMFEQYWADHWHEEIQAGNGGLDKGEAKALAAQRAFRNAIAVQIEGNQASSRQFLQGMQHLMSTQNTVAGINQALAGNSWWRAKTATGTGAVSMDHVYADQHLLKAQDDGGEFTPDCIMADYVPGGVNVYGRLMNFAQGVQRIVDAEFTAKYGFTKVFLADMAVFMNSRGPGGTYRMHCSKCFGWNGDTRPYMLPPQPIPKSQSKQRGLAMVATFWCDDIQRQLLRSGISG